jgi:uncharacterized protein YqcC (DUF446 family)
LAPEQREQALIAVIDALEAELRRLELWEREPPSAALLASTQPFAVDTLRFSQWLQWLLIPRMRRIFKGEGSLPTKSAIHPYAEDCVDDVDDPRPLLLLIERFDGLIRNESAAITH